MLTALSLFPTDIPGNCIFPHQSCQALSSGEGWQSCSHKPEQSRGPFLLLFCIFLYNKSSALKDMPVLCHSYFIPQLWEWEWHRAGVRREGCSQRRVSIEPGAGICRQCPPCSSTPGDTRCPKSHWWDQEETLSQLKGAGTSRHHPTAWGKHHLHSCSNLISQGTAWEQTLLDPMGDASWESLKIGSEKPIT